MVNILSQYGITCEEALEGAVKIAEIVAKCSPSPDQEIFYIRNNPSLSLFQKIKLIRQIKKDNQMRL